MQCYDQVSKVHSPRSISIDVAVIAEYKAQALIEIIAMKEKAGRGKRKMLKSRWARVVLPVDEGPETPSKKMG